MKKYINHINTTQLIKIIYLLNALVCITSLLHAQPPGPGGENDAPIDGGLSLLIAGGVGYGIKKLKKQKE